MNNFPNTIQLGDVSKISYRNGVLITEYGRFKVGNIDLLIGGSPCQSFTFAGKQNGMTTTDDINIVSLNQYLDLQRQGFAFKGESYLFWEYVRLYNEIRPEHYNKCYGCRTYKI